MDFFDRQEASQRATRWLVLTFGLAFLVIALVTGVALMILLGFATNGGGQIVAAGDVGSVLLARLDQLLVIIAVVAGLMIVASLFRTATLSQGGGHVARMLGGTQVSGDDPDPLHRRLINVVEEMAIASGLPVPEIYVLTAERGINAFAAGLTPADAAIAVTRGSLEQLDRNELQGVVAHEFSHILNGDMRLNLRLMGFSFGILVLSLVGRWLLRASTRGVRFGRRDKGSPAIFIGLALTIIGAIGVVLSRLIKAAVSRQREVLADASAVQFTREPLALAGALRKIGGFTPYLETVDSEEVSHMLFGRAGRSFAGLFATHPPLDERIRALDPAFVAGDYVAPSMPAPAGAATAASHGGAAGVSSLAGAMGSGDSSARGRAAGVDAGGTAADAVTVESAGRIHPDAGRALHAALPADIVDAAHSSQSAWLLVLALGLEFGGGTETERRLLESQIGAERAARCENLRRALDRLDPGLRLPLFELAVPALKARPPKQIDFLFELLGRLAEADGKRTLAEYLLARLLRAHLDPGPGLAASAAERRAAAECLLASMAAAGSPDTASRLAAYAAGVAKLGGDVSATSIVDAVADNFAALDTALARLQAAPGRERRSVLRALAVTLRHDGRARVAEAELFRTIAAVLGTPIPPAIPAAQNAAIG